MVPLWAILGGILLVQAVVVVVGVAVWRWLER